MTPVHGPIDHDTHDSVYDGLLTEDAGQWAFGAGFSVPPADDPLAGVTAEVPDGVDATALGRYCLMLGDDALIHSQRLAAWCSNAPDLEEDIALANVALDLLGQARLLLARAAAVDPELVPALPPGSPVTAEDALAFFRDGAQFRHVHLVEQPNGDFAETITRLLVHATFRLAVLDRLRDSRDVVLAAVATKAVKELAYHRDHAARWFVVLAQGTEESRRRLLAGLDVVRPAVEELFAAHPVTEALAAQGVGVDPADVRDEVERVLGEVFAAAGVSTGSTSEGSTSGGGVSTGSTSGGSTSGGSTSGAGRYGEHGPELAALLAEMQVVARAHPRGLW